MENNCLICNHKWNCRADNKIKFALKCPSCTSTNWDIGDMVKCIGCNRTIIDPEIHHLNGNHLDNSKENRAGICKRCHGAVHNGIYEGNKKAGNGNSRKAPVRFNNYEIRDNLRQLRKLWLHNKKRISRSSSNTKPKCI
jgi:hypothetical protein